MKSISDQQIDAFVDGQLDHRDRIEILQAMESSPAVRNRVAQARHLKDLLRLTYQDEAPAMPQAASRAARYSSHIAAAVLGALAMFLLLQLGAPTTRSVSPFAYVDGGDAMHGDGLSKTGGQEIEQVLFHLSSSDVRDGRVLLEQVELVASRFDAAGRALRIIVLTNNEGLRFYQAGVSEQAANIHELNARFDNIVFAACGTTLGKLRGAGETIELLPEVIVVDSGVAEIARRQQQGWKYIRI